MGTYYSLLNDTQKKTLHLDYHIKSGPITMNEAVHYAFINYMFENQGDVFRLVDEYKEPDDYEEVDLLKYRYSDPATIREIVKKLNRIYGRPKRYKIRNGIGEEEK